MRGAERLTPSTQRPISTPSPACCIRMSSIARLAGAELLINPRRSSSLSSSPLTGVLAGPAQSSYCDCGSQFHSLVKYEAKEPATAAMTVTM